MMVCHGAIGQSPLDWNPGMKFNHGLFGDIQGQKTGITEGMVQEYWQKRISELTINQVSVDQCPEIEVVVSLLDDEGNPISGLTSSDFEVREDGVLLPINVRPTTSGVGSGVSLAICIDISGSLSSSDLQNEKSAAVQLVNLLGENDSVAIYAFGSGVSLVQDFTSDKVAAINAINGIRGGGSTSLYDAVYTALNNTSQQNGRKAVVVMTDGGDNSSSNGLQDVINLATATNIPLFTIGFGNASVSVLEAMANMTGGVFFPSATSQDLLAILDRIGTILGQQYIISFRTPSPDGGVHDLAVEADAGGTILSDARTYSGCLYEPVPDAPTFIDETNFFIGSDGSLICIYPDPNSDGSNVDGLDNFSYLTYLLVDCQIVEGPVLIGQNDGGDTWPKVVVLASEDLPNQPFTIQVSRIYEGQTTSEAPVIEIQGPSAPSETIPTNFRGYKRWLLHMPRQAGGYQGLFRLINANPLPAEVTLAGFDEAGNLLRAVQLTVPERGIMYQDLYGNGLFAEFTDRISHVGIYEPNKLTDVWFQYQNIASRYNSWVPEVLLDEGLATSSTLEMESRGDDRYTDGVVVLNLSNAQATQPFAVQRDRSSGSVLAEVQLDVIPPGGKLRVILSDLFPFQSNSVYRFETRNNRETIQALGLSFFGSDFFAPLPIIRP